MRCNRAELDSAKFTTGTVVARKDLADDLWTVRIRPGQPISFRAGQYVTVALESGGALLERPYSIASAPEEDEVELFIELVPGDALTPQLHPLVPGASVVLRRRCKGIFLKDCPVAEEAHLFVATVTGIAPFLSLIRRLVSRYRSGQWDPGEQRFLLLQGASRSMEFGYLEEMRQIDAEMAWFTYVPAVSRPWLAPSWSGEVGRVEDVLRKHADDLDITPSSAGVYLCGHPGMIAATRDIMKRRGFDDKAIREEQFWPEGQTSASR